MKTIKTISLAFSLLLSTFAFGQKLGHINSNKLLQSMPENSEIEAKIHEYAKELEDQLGSMTKEYQTKIQEYQAKESSMSESVKQDKITEITNLEDRIQSFQKKAQNDLQKKEDELLKPIIDRARDAIEEVAKEGGFTYIFDSGVGALLYQKDSQDIMPQVKKKLGIL